MIERKENLMMQRDSEISEFSYKQHDVPRKFVVEYHETKLMFPNNIDLKEACGTVRVTLSVAAASRGRPVAVKNCRFLC